MPPDRTNTLMISRVSIAFQSKVIVQTAYMYMYVTSKMTWPQKMTWPDLIFKNWDTLIVRRYALMTFCKFQIDSMKIVAIVGRTANIFRGQAIFRRHFSLGHVTWWPDLSRLSNEIFYAICRTVWGTGMPNFETISLLLLELRQKNSRGGRKSTPGRVRVNDIVRSDISLLKQMKCSEKYASNWIEFLTWIN